MQLVIHLLEIKKFPEEKQYISCVYDVPCAKKVKKNKSSATPPLIGQFKILPTNRNNVQFQPIFSF